MQQFSVYTCMEELECSQNFHVLFKILTRPFLYNEPIKTIFACFTGSRAANENISTKYLCVVKEMPLNREVIWEVYYEIK